MDIPAGIRARVVDGIDQEAQTKVEEVIELLECEGCGETILYDSWEGNYYQKEKGEWKRIELYMNEDISDYGYGSFCTKDCYYDWEHRVETRNWGRW